MRGLNAHRLTGSRSWVCVCRHLRRDGPAASEFSMAAYHDRRDAARGLRSWAGARAAVPERAEATGPRRSPCYPLSLSRRDSPALKVSTVRAGMGTASPVRGLRPCRAARWLEAKLSELHDVDGLAPFECVGDSRDDGVDRGGGIDPEER